MFKFLRFEIGGVSTFIWIIIFSFPYINTEEFLKIDVGDLIATAVGAIAIFLPLGNYIHQIVDSIANPFLAKRARFYERKSLKFIEDQLGESKTKFSDSTYQSLIVFSEAISQKWKAVNKDTPPTHTHVDEFSLDASIIRENITNRYSYYYARIESGLFAPVFGCLISHGLLNFLNDKKFVLSAPQVEPALIYVFAVVIMVGMVWRIPQLFRELDDLEIMLVQAQKNIWERMLP